jgi:preprotein translocase subunit SecA
MEVAHILDRVVASFIGTRHERDIKKLQPAVAFINALEPEIQALSDEQLKERFAALREQVQEQLKKVEPGDESFKEDLRRALEPAIVPAFAMVREAGRRFLKMRHFDVQLIGGNFGNENRGREDPGGDTAGGFKRTGRARRASRDRQRLLGATRRGMDEPAL